MGGSPPPARTNRDASALVVGLAVLALGMVAVRHGRVSSAEKWTFHRINDLPGWLYGAAWPLQQVGALAVGLIVAIVALVMHRRRLAIAALLVTVLKLVSERGVKAIVSRERPGTSIGADVNLRGDVPPAGESFVSGHAVLVAGLAGVIAPFLPGRWRLVPWAVVLGVMIGRVYVGAHNPLDVVCGAALGVAIAAIVRLALGIGRPVPGSVTADVENGAPVAPPTGTTHLARAVLVGVLALPAVAAVPVGAASAGSPSTLDDDDVTVASFDFAESRVLAEVYSQTLEAAGFTVQRAYGLGPREFVGPALDAGLVELVPEYAGTAAEFYSVGVAEPDDDVTATHDQLVAALAGDPIVALAPAPAQDANTFVVTRTTAERLHVATLSDLTHVDGPLTLGGPSECPARPLCLVGLDDVYGLSFDRFLGLDTGGPLTVQALREGHIDVGLLFTTDPILDDPDFVELADDRRLQPAENVTPLIRAELVDRWGAGITDVVDAASARLTTEAVRDLNRELSDGDATVTSVVAAWLAGT